MKRVEALTPNRLRKYRLLMGYEQKEVASFLGLKSHSRVSEWEAGVRKPSLDNLFKLSILYRTLPDELYYDLRQKLIRGIARRERVLKAERDQGG